MVARGDADDEPATTDCYLPNAIPGPQKYVEI